MDPRENFADKEKIFIIYWLIGRYIYFSINNRKGLNMGVLIVVANGSVKLPEAPIRQAAVRQREPFALTAFDCQYGGCTVMIHTHANRIVTGSCVF